MGIFNRGFWAIFIIILFVVVLLGGVFFLTINSKTENQNIFETIEEFFTKDNNGNNPDSNDDFSDTGKEGSSGAGASGSSGSGSGGGNSGSQFCQMEQIKYSLLNINKNSICNVEQNGICEDKTVNCDIEVHNDDNEASGLFKIELYFVESGKNISQAIDIKTGEFTISPFQLKLFQDLINIQSTGENGTANKKINCIFQTVEIPEKEVCY